MIEEINTQLRRGECSERRRHEAPCATCDAVNARIAWLCAHAGGELPTGDRLDDWMLGAIAFEARRQRTLMFPVADAQKTPTDWVWTLGSLVAKAVHRPERRAEHIIQAAGLLVNWHRHVTERGE